MGIYRLSDRTVSGANVNAPARLRLFHPAAAGLLECARVLASLFGTAGSLNCLTLEIVGHANPIGFERIHRFHKAHTRTSFEPGRRTPRILIGDRNQAVFYGMLVDIVQSCQPRFLKRQVRIPEFIQHSPARSGIDPVEPNCQFPVQVSYQIPVRRRAAFEADHEVIMIRKESPRL